MGAAVKRRSLGFLRGRVEEGKVCLTAYKTQRYCGEEHAAEFSRLRVYRKEVEFLFNTDYAEFFDGLSPSPSDLLFEGPLEAGNGRKFTYIDRTAQVGRTYAYFLGSASGDIPLTGPVPVRVRDQEVWWPYARVVDRLRRMEQAYPGLARVEEIGRTARGNALHGVLVGRGERMIGLVGAVHAGESGPELIVPALEAFLEQHRHLLERVCFVAIPSVNWEERDRMVYGLPWYLRVNANGVDLNRNFPADWEQVEYGYGLVSSDPDAATYRGAAPGSEPETQAVMRFFRKYPPAVVFSYHALASFTGNSFLVSRLGEADPDYRWQAEAWSSVYGAAYDEGSEPGTTLSYACSAGSLSNWIYREFGAVCFDLELGRNDPRDCVEDRVSRDLLATCRARHLAGIARVAGQI
jgi:hypothetical protein